MTAQPTHLFEARHTLLLVTVLTSLAAACASQTSDESDPSGSGSVSGPVPSGSSTGTPGGGSDLSGIAGSGATTPTNTGTGTTPTPTDTGTDPIPGDPVTGVEDLMPPAGETLTPARCGGDASKTIIIGDSYIALSGDIPRMLTQYSGQTYRLHAVSGTAMVGGLPPSIPDQYRIAAGAGAVETIIMDGGGNDVLLGDPSCRTVPVTGPDASSMCAMTIQRAVQGAKDLLNEAAAAGAREVVYFLYPHLTGLNVNLNPALDYAYPLFEEACASVNVDCKLIDTRAAFEGHPEYLGIDGIHPTFAGSETISKMVWEVMGFNCDNGVAVK